MKKWKCFVWVSISETERVPLNWLGAGSARGPSPRYLFWESKLQTAVCCGGAGRGSPFTTSPISTVFFARMTSDFFWDGGGSGSWYVIRLSSTTLWTMFSLTFVEHLYKIWSTPVSQWLLTPPRRLSLCVCQTKSRHSLIVDVEAVLLDEVRCLFSVAEH